MKRALSLLVCTLCLFSAVSASALTLVDVVLADKVKLGEKTLLLNGAGIRKATIFRVKVYVAGLYLEEKSSSAETIVKSSGDKQLDMHFVRDVGVDKLRDGWSEGFKKNTENIEPMKGKIATFNSWMSDIQEGQSIKLYFTNDNVSVEFAGKSMGDIQGRDFAQALLRIWLGENPPNEDLKQGLLGLS